MIKIVIALLVVVAVIGALIVCSCCIVAGRANDEAEALDIAEENAERPEVDYFMSRVDLVSECEDDDKGEDFEPMEETQMDKLLEALKLIRDECKQHDNCKECPMWALHTCVCGVDNTPREWRVRDEVKIRPSVIRDEN